MKKRYGWTVWGIIGFSFLPVTVLLLAAGAIVAAVKPDKGGQELLMYFVIMGSIFLVISVGFLYKDLKRRHQQRMAWEGGYEVKARVTEIRTIRNVRVNGQNPVVLVCEYQGNTYTSRYLYRDVPEVGTEVSVYLDRMDAQIGFVDV